MGKRDQRRRRQKIKARELANPGKGAEAAASRKKQALLDAINERKRLCSEEPSTGTIDETFEENSHVFSERSQQSEQV